MEDTIINKVARIASNMYRLGWDERNGGNISCMIDEEEISSFVDTSKVIRMIPMCFDASQLSGKIFIVTGTGSYFRNVELFPEENLGIFRISKSGRELELLWGYSKGGSPTSELPAHLMTHINRLKVDSKHRVVIHTHATNTLAMTYIHTLNEKEFTKTLWRMCTECVVVFPDGVSVLPWMLCGTDSIGEATAEKMKQSRVVIWAQHGVFAAGKDIDETFGLIETVEKAAEIYVKIQNSDIVNTINDDQLIELANYFGVKPKEGYLDCSKHSISR